MRSVIRQAKTVDEAIDEALTILSTDRDSVDIEIIAEAKPGFLGFIGARDAVVKVSIKEEDQVSNIINEVFYKKEDKESQDLENDLEAERTFLEEGQSSDHVEIKDIEDHSSKSSENDLANKDLEGQEDKPSNDEKEEIPLDQGKIEVETSLEKSEEKLASEVLLAKILKAMDIGGDIVTNIDGNNIQMEIINTDQRDTSIIIGKRGDTLDAIQYIISLAENKGPGQYMRVHLDISNYRQRRKDSLIKLANNMAQKALRQNRNIKLEPMNAYERKIIHSTLQSVEGIQTYSEGKDPRRKVIIKPIAN